MTQDQTPILRDALDHIARSAAASRSQTRRLRWIEQRARLALTGERYSEESFSLPKSAGPDTPEKLQKRLAYHIAIKHQLLEALERIAAYPHQRGDKMSIETARGIARAAIDAATESGAA